jgi:glycosyltransferase involved in cell wall biosynthesis
MKLPSVTVLVDTFNHQRFIEHALSSVLAQDFPVSETEIIIVDDGSTDRTPEILAKFAPRVRVVRKRSGGQASAFNLGIQEARGEILAFLDGDDWWAPNKLTRVMDAMQDRSVGIVGHGIVVVLPDGREQAETLREGFRFRANTVEGARLLRVRRSFLGTRRMTIRASLLQQIGRVPEAIEIEADEYLFTLAAVLSEARVLPETLTYYRLHDANAYQMTTPDPKRIRCKQQAIAALARALYAQLERYNVPYWVRVEITKIARAEADQMRLSLGDGWSWETVRTEWTIYQTLHPDASSRQRAFKLLTLLPGLLVPPRDFYRIRRKVATNDAYVCARKRWLPVPAMTHIEKSLTPGPKPTEQPPERVSQVSNVRRTK